MEDNIEVHYALILPRLQKKKKKFGKTCSQDAFHHV